MTKFLHSYGVFWRVSTGCGEVWEMTGRYWLPIERTWWVSDDDAGKMGTACVTSSNVLILGLDESMTENHQEVLPD
jgi:hypothetical protein